MASRVFALTERGEMAAGDLKRVLDAVDRISGAVEKLSIETRESTATLKSEVGFMSEALRDLRRQVEDKATRPELTSVEARLRDSVADVKAGAAFEAGRLSRDLTDKLDLASADLMAFREDVKAEFTQLRDRDIKDLATKVASHEDLRNKLVGAWAVSGLLGTVLGIVGGWFIHLFFSKP